MLFVDKARATIGASRFVVRATIVLSIILLFSMTSWHVRDRSEPPLANKLLKPFGDSINVELPHNSAERWALIHKIFGSHNPGNPLSTNVNNAGKAEKFEEKWKTCQRPETDYISLEPHQLEKAKHAHANFLQELPELAKHFTYKKGSRGIVVTTAGDGNTILTVSLKMLRSTGCTLPVEVFMAKWNDYEPKLCEKVYPSLNAKCVLLGEEVLDIATPLGTPNLWGYQLKPMAILMSSFDEVLFLDADSFPIIDPEALFESEPFKKTGLITWPDLWCATQSKLWYQITGAEVIPTKDRASSESGQIMYDKTRHIQDLLLTCYYNYHGTGLWWQLLTQGSMGEGDKETYVNAADVLSQPSWQVSQPSIMLPPRDAPGTAIVQANPAIDYQLAKSGRGWKDGAMAPFAFIHNHWPKAQAYNLMNSDFDWLHSAPRRFWGSKEDMMNLFGHDWEHELWKSIEYTACEVGHMYKAWEGKESSCKFVQKHIGLVFQPERTLAAGLLPDKSDKSGKN